MKHKIFCNFIEIFEKYFGIVILSGAKDLALITSIFVGRAAPSE
jgi:hypothetical protein